MIQVILIDDDRDDAELFREALSEVNAGAQFRHFEQPEEALELLLAKETNLPDFIFLDINMPVINGWECLTEFKKSDQMKHVPVIMYTTSSQSREKEMAREFGADGFITKPDDYTLLKNLLFGILHQP